MIYQGNAFANLGCNCKPFNSKPDHTLCEIAIVLLLISLYCAFLETTPTRSCYYRSPTKFQEGNVLSCCVCLFMYVCLSVCLFTEGSPCDHYQRCHWSVTGQVEAPLGPNSPCLHHLGTPGMFILVQLGRHYRGYKDLPPSEKYSNLFTV